MAELKPYEQALDNFRQELKKAILNEEIPMTFGPSDASGYFAEVSFSIRNQTYKMTVAETFICYLSPVLEGLFKDEADFEAFKTIIKKHVKILTAEDKARIGELQAEIDRIKGVE